MPKLFIVMGKSATGKDTVYKALLEQTQVIFKEIIGYTTRPIREGEAEGVEYHFVDEKCLNQLQEARKVIEVRSYHTVHGIWNYFTVDDGQINLHLHNYLMIGTLEVFGQLQRYFGKENVVPIYIEVDDGIRLKRALDRELKQNEPKYSEMCRRYLADESDFSESNIKGLEIYKRYQNIDMGICIRQIIDDIKNIG